MYDIITVGSATVDVAAKVASQLVKIQTNSDTHALLAYPSGTKILIQDLNYSIGGGGTNSAVAFARLGHKTGYIGKLGSGYNSELILKTLKKEKTAFLGVQSKLHAGFSIILSTLENDRTILTHKGANNDLKLKEINLKKLRTKWFYFSSMVEESFRTLIELSKFAEKNKIKIAFNPSNYICEKGISSIKEILSRTTILVLNKEEAELLTKTPQIKTMLKLLHASGPEIVAITQGKKGAWAFDGKNLYCVRPPSIHVVDATGAGDAFASSFVCGIMRDRGIEKALMLGVGNAQSVISHQGAKNGLLSYNKVCARIKKLNVKKSNL